MDTPTRIKPASSCCASIHREADDPTLNSAVSFATVSRVHVAIAVGDVERSAAFYRHLFAQEPTKRRDGYAKFEVAEPPVNFTLNQAPAALVEALREHTGPRHFGIQVKSTRAVADAKARLEEAGLETISEEQVSCCYAVQDKIWVEDPDGHRWEIFVVTDADAPRYERIPADARADEQPDADGDSPCCAPSCCA